jgi:excisionase family DNA binding protein
MITAKRVYNEIERMSDEEISKLFNLLAESVIANKHNADEQEKEFYTHEEVFGDLYTKPFTITEAANYLKVSSITIRRYIKDGKLPAKRIGKSYVFNVGDLRKFKKKGQENAIAPATDQARN